MARSVVIVAPRFASLARHGGRTCEARFQVMTRRGAPASMVNLDTVINSPLREPPLGAGLVGAGPMAAYYLESFLKTRGFETRTVVAWDGPSSLARAMECDPVAVLFSTTFVTDAATLRSCLREVRSVVGATPIIVGGPLINGQRKALRAGDSRRARALERFGADRRAELLFGGGGDPALDGCIFVASPQGEHTAIRVLDLIGRGRGLDDLADTPNLVLRDAAGEWRFTGKWVEPLDLDDDYTRWDLIDELPAVIPVRCGVGCRGRCRFCGFRTLNPRTASRVPRSVIAEMRLAIARGGVFFNMVDEDVLAWSGAGLDLPALLAGEEMNVVWGGFFQASRVTEENADRITASGFRYGLTGVESGHPEQLERMGKSGDLGAVRRGVELLIDGGARIDLTFVLGFPGETLETLESTARFIDSIPRGRKGYAFYELFPFELFPGTTADTPLFRSRHQLRGTGRDWYHSTMSYREVVDEYAPLVFARVGSTPYGHGGEDAPHWWSPSRRDRAFEERCRLSHAFMDNLDDGEIQARFQALYALVADPERSSHAPAWSRILAPRADQPTRGTP